MVSKHGLREILLVSLLAGSLTAASIWAAIAVSPWWAVAALPALDAWVLVLLFFRDPQRATPTDPGVLVSPADGRVTEIAQLTSHPDVRGPALRIGIFLSIFDVHVNRVPCAGRVLRTTYRPGSFLDARDPASGARNEANTIVIEPEDDFGGPVVVRQIAGLIARRIVCTAKAGDRVMRGQRMGMIKFGSRTELIVSARGGLTPMVRVNDAVRGGSTVLLAAGGPPEADRALDGATSTVWREATAA